MEALPSNSDNRGERHAAVDARMAGVVDLAGGGRRQFARADGMVPAGQAEL